MTLLDICRGLTLWKSLRKLASFVLSLLVAACAVTSLACNRQMEDPGGADDPEVAQLGDDTFMSGNELRLEREVRGDAVLAGERITVAAPVRGDGVFAGGELELSGPFEQDVYAAGGQVHVTGNVAGSGRFAGGRVTFGPDSSARGGVSIAAGRAELTGDFGGYLQVIAGSARLDGHVAGDVLVSGGQLEIGPSAVIDGGLVVRGPREADIAPGAVIRGEVQHVSADAPGAWGWMAFLLFALVAVVGLALVAGLIGSLWPGFTRSVEEVVLERPGAALLAGLGVLIGAPIAMLLLAFSLVGLPLALLALPVYLMLFPLGYLAAAGSIADWLLQRVHPRASGLWLKRLLTLMLLLLGFTLIGFIPVVGVLSVSVLTLIGMGALVMAAVEAHRGRRERAAAPAPRPGGWKPSEEAAPTSA